MVFVPIEGVDYSWARPDPYELYRLGYRFAIRYLSYNDSGKNLSAAEATKLRAAGLDIVSNWEWDARDALGGYSYGKRHATEAKQQHDDCGGPASAPIYFSIDWDASKTELGVAEAYIDGCAEILGRSRVGVYGGYRTIDYFADRGITWLWQTRGWSKWRDADGVERVHWHPAALIRQYRVGATIAGKDCDVNRAVTSVYGQWGAVRSGGAYLPVEDDMQPDDKLPFPSWAQDYFGHGPEIYVRTTLASGYAHSREAKDRVKALQSTLASHGALLEQLIAAQSGLTTDEIRAAVAAGVREGLPDASQIAAEVVAAVVDDLEDEIDASTLGPVVEAALRRVFGGLDEAA